MVYQDLSISNAAKLKEIYKSDEIAEYLLEASLWFLDDTRLVMSHIFESGYSDYAILKSKLLLETYINVQNARKLKEKLGNLLVDLESITAN